VASLPNTGVAQAMSLTAGQPNPLEQPILPQLFAQPPPQQQMASGPMSNTAQAMAPDYGSLVNEAAQRDVALQQAAAQYAPSQEYNQGALSAIAALGNVAGAVSGQGAIGAPALQMAEQLRQEGRLQQESFFRRVRQEEETIKLERAARAQMENAALRADSIRPLIESKVSDPLEKAMLYQALAAGKIDETQAFIQKYEENQLNVDRAKLELQHKRELFPYQKSKAVQDVTLGDQRISENYVDFAAKTGGLNSLPASARRELMQKQGQEFTKAIEKDLPTMNTFLQVDRLVGGLGTEAAQKRLERILGLGGTIKGAYTGSQEDRELFSSINKMFASAKTRDFGASLTDGEKKLLDAGLGFSLGNSLYSNTFADAATLNSLLSKLGEEIGGKLSLAQNGLDPAVIKELSKDGMPFKSLDNFSQVRALHRDIGGYKGNLDVPPPELKSAGVSNDDWIGLSPIQKLNLIKSMRQ
jgi:hypothetical protein